MQAAFLATVVGTTGFLGVLAGQLPGVTSHFLYILYLIIYIACFSYKMVKHLGMNPLHIAMSFGNVNEFVYAIFTISIGCISCL